MAAREGPPRPGLVALVRASPDLGGLAAGSLAGALTSGLLVPTLPLFLFARGFTILQLGWLFTLAALAAAGLQLAAGRYERQIARPRVVLALLALPVALFPAYLAARTPFELFVVYALGTLAAAAAGPGMQILLADLAPDATRVHLYASLGRATSLAHAAGLVLGGALLILGYAAVFHAAAFASLLALAAFAWALQRRHGPASERAAARRGIQAWSAELRRAGAAMQTRTRDPQERRNAAAGAAHTFLFTAALAAFPLYLPIHLRALGLPVAWTGVAIAASWVAFALAQPWGAAASTSLGWRRTVGGSLAASGALALAIAWAPLGPALAAWVALGVTDGFGRPVLQATLAASAPPSRRGRVFGPSQAAATLARSLAPLALAVLIEALGLAAALGVGSLLMLLSIVPLHALRPLPSPATSRADAS